MLIEAEPEAFLAPGIYSRFNNEHYLPFLFKVLSISKALPLKAHTDKAEVVVALSDTFEAFVSFRPVPEIKSFLKVVSELRNILSDHQAVEEFLSGSDDGEKEHGLLKKIFSELLETSHVEISTFL